MILQHICVGTFRTNCYIIGDESTNEVFIIDPGSDGEIINNIIVKNGYKVKYIILTHGHFDHIGEVKYLKELTKAQILIHKNDGEMLVDPNKSLASFVQSNFKDFIQVEADKYLEDGDTLDLGQSTFKIIHTPGHTKGGICILYNDCLFSGDTLFKETIGRTDLPHSNHEDILISVQKLAKLDDNIKLYPGHGVFSTIGHEKKYNSFM